MTRLRFLPWLLLCLLAGACQDDSNQSGEAIGPVTIYSTTDQNIFDPVIADFRSLNPKVKVKYVELSAHELNERYLAETARKQPGADILLSTGMDLQVKLVNDGHAARHESLNAQHIPPWANWRNEAFGLTFEPVVMAYNRDMMRGRKVPHSRPELLEAVQLDPAFWHRRLGTYDIAASKVGYLMASQDARLSAEYAALASAFGMVQARTYGNSSAMLDALEKGEIAMAYNLLGSYASGRIKAGAKIEIIYPEDYTLAVMRTAIIPKNAPHPDNAHKFLEYILSPRGQKMMTERSHLVALRRQIGDRNTIFSPGQEQDVSLRPIKLGPGLLVYLDQQKRGRLLDNWQRMVKSDSFPTPE